MDANFKTLRSFNRVEELYVGSGAPQNILSLDSYCAFEQLYMNGLFCNVSVSFRENMSFGTNKKIRDLLHIYATALGD